MGISCKKAVDFISKKEEGKLSFKQRAQLWYHLAICRFCRTFEEQNKLLITIFHQRSKDQVVTLNEAEKKAIIKVLEDADNG